MKIVNLEKFLDCPPGTLFAEYTPCVIGDLEILGSVCKEKVLTNSNYLRYSLVDTEKELWFLEPGKEMQLEHESYSRSGPGLKADQLFVVFSKPDVVKLVKSLETACLRISPEKPKNRLSLFVPDYNPFIRYEPFRRIWENRGAVPSQDFQSWLEQPAKEVKFLIVVDTLIVGLTGLWEMEPEKVALAWHGIIPTERGKGYSEETLKRLIEMSPQLFPDAKVLVESIPKDREEELAKHFTKLGFVRTGNVVDHPEMMQGVKWMEYIYKL